MPKLNFLYKDNFIFAISKPANIHSVINDNSNELSIASLLLEKYPNLLDVAKKEDAGLLNRLDFATSGILFGAWKKEYWEKIHKENDKIKKTYLAVVEGQAKNTTIKTFIGGAYRGSKKVRLYSLSKNPKRALIGETKISLLAFNKKKNISLVSTTVFSAKRHQIRAHLASIKNPLVGDSLYGATSKVADFFEFDTNYEFLLHNDSLEFFNSLSNNHLKILNYCPWESQFLNIYQY